MAVTVELVGLEVFGHHGATEEERFLGRMLVYDLEWVVGDEALSDRLDDTVDYDHVAKLVREVSGRTQFRLLEALAGSVADAMVERFPGLSRVRVRVRKPGITVSGLALEYSAATVERSR